MKPSCAVWFALPLVLACSRVTPSAPGIGSPGSAASDASRATGSANRVSQPGTPLEPTGSVAATFRLVKELGCDEAILHTLSAKTFLSCNQELMTVEGDEVRDDPTYQRGIEPEQPIFAWQIASIAGHWPDAVWLGRNRTTEYAAQGEFFRWKAQRWIKVAAAGQDEPLWELLPWTGRRVLALVQPFYTFGARFIALGEDDAVVPRFTAPKVPHEYCRSRLRAEAQIAAAPGELFVAGGQVCEVVSGKGQRELIHAGLGVERFTAHEPQGRLLLLETPSEAPPDATWKVTALVAVGPQEILLAAQAALDGSRTVSTLARWDGTRFRSQPPPFAGAIQRLWVAGAGELWATDLQGRLWRRRAQHWQRVGWQPPHPSDTEITRVWARGPSDVWLLTRRLSANRSAVYHGRTD